jgi:DNA (cytosine-5)-methyltransferase 1
MSSSPLKFIDLFSGIGGFHQALRRVVPSAECVHASDIDSAAQAAYQANYEVHPAGDIRTLDEDSLPPFSLLCGGFPCQAFSAAGKKQAFADPRGTLFFEILRLVDLRTPDTLLLENVANLLTIEKGAVFARMQTELTSRGYHVSYAILSPHHFGVPQSRERVYIVASKTVEFSFDELRSHTTSCSLRSILDPTASGYLDPSTYVLLPESQVKTQRKSGLRFCGYLKGTIRKTGVRENTEHLSRTHKQTMRIHSADGTQPTLAASETSGRYHIYDGVGVRRLTLAECYRLMDFPSDFKLHSVKGTAYKQIGNSVCVRVVEAVLREMVRQKVL